MKESTNLFENQSVKGRRTFCYQLFATSTVVALVPILDGCMPKKQEEAEVDTLDVSRCDDLTKVAEEEVTKRNNFGYEKEGTMPDKKCGNCNLYIPAKEGQACGGCILFKGPVFENAYCTYWAPQVQ